MHITPEICSANRELTPLWAWFRSVSNGWYNEVILACTLDPSRFYRGWGFIRWRESCSI